MMTRRTKGLLAIVPALVIGCGAVLLLEREARPTRQTPQRTTEGPTSGSRRHGAVVDLQEVTVVVTIPGTGGASRQASAPVESDGRRPRVGGHGGGCAVTQVGMILGLHIAQPHGCILGSVMPDGPAAEAGLRAGDGIVGCDGSKVTCPSSLLPHLAADADSREVKLTVLRPKRDGEGERAEHGERQASRTADGGH
jgi:membrane-associated protease RseP (regulator of RpoE activity)